MNKHNRGDKRKDGKVFWQYSDRYKLGEIWIPEESYNNYIKKDNRPKDRPLKCGDTRSDGRVFWCYNQKSLNGEWWITKEKYLEKMNKSRERDKARYKKRKSSPGWKKYHREHHKQRIQEDESYRIAHNLRGSLSSRLKSFLNNKKVSAVKDLGCDLKSFKSYLETRFKSGMTWENYGKVWSIDHVIPMASFDLSKKSEQKKACHYTNLQPMLCLENISKGCKTLKQQTLC